MFTIAGGILLALAVLTVVGLVAGKLVSWLMDTDFQYAEQHPVPDFWNKKRELPASLRKLQTILSDWQRKQRVSHNQTSP
jgi:hypothetical protein